MQAGDEWSNINYPKILACENKATLLHLLLLPPLLMTQCSIATFLSSGGGRGEITGKKQVLHATYKITGLNKILCSTFKVRQNNAISIKTPKATSLKTAIKLITTVTPTIPIMIIKDNDLIKE